LTPLISLREALADPALLGTVLAGDSWRAWRTLLIAAVGEALSEDERRLYGELTGRGHEPGQRVEELVAVIGRRGGKSRAVATLAAYIAGLCDHRELLAPGERGVLLCIAPDHRQATITIDYASAAFEAAPIMRQLIAGKTADTLSLTTGIDIEVRAASFRRLRGPTYIAVIADEAAFWYSDELSANTDSEILNAVRPGLATTRGLLAIISSPYARRGEVWNAYHRHYGPDGDPLILVAQGASRTFNPTLPQSVVDRAMERDAAAANAEYLAQFRTDLEAFVSREAVEACIELGCRERAPLANAQYAAFIDVSGGSHDSMTLAIGHSEDDVAVLDLVREVRPPFSPEAVVADFAMQMKAYGVSAAVGDKYGGEWPREVFAKYSVSYEPSAAPKSDLYRDCLPLINSRKVKLLDNQRLASQFVGLERRTSRAGKDSIDHAPGGHDDLANATAGVLVSLGADDAAQYTYGILHHVSTPTERGERATQQALTRAERRGQHRNPWHHPGILHY